MDREAGVGILGGTFDPIHNGHLAIAAAVYQKLKPEYVLVVPAGEPWLKRDVPVSPAVHRVNMVRLAIQYKPYLKLSTIEIDKHGPSYTVETIAELRQRQNPGTIFYFILGADSLADLPRWKEPQRLVAMCRLVVVPRPGSPDIDLNSLEEAVPGIAAHTICLNEPVLDISATDIRRRVAEGLPVNSLVPAAVAEYIKNNKLYRRY